MLVLMKGLNEERLVNRCISDFHDEEWVERIIVIDGCSTDYTVQELRQFSKVEVYQHCWIDSFHDMEVTQSNICLSYIPHKQIAMILDFDERMSPELKQVLSDIDKGLYSFTTDTIHFSRRTIEPLRYENTPFAMIGEDGWPIESHQIGQYPDFQCRLIRKNFELRWVNSPHHIMIGAKSNENIEADIIHYEKDDYRDRERIEKKWLRSQARRKELGLPFDIFETSIKPELHKYLNPSYWKNGASW